MPEDVPPGGTSALPSGPELQATQSPLGDAVAVGGCRGGVAAKMGRRRRAIPNLENKRALATRI